MQRNELLSRFREMVQRGEPIIGGGAGTGLSAKCEEAGGIDLIVLYNSGRFRMAGRGSLSGLLAYGDANAIVVEMAAEVLPIVKHTPVLAGVNGTDPFRKMGVFLDELRRIGFSGVQNFPTVGLIDGTFRLNLEETGISYAQEVDLIRIAREKELLTTPYVFSEADAEEMARAGADIIVCHLGLTTGGSIGAATAASLQECPAKVDAWAGAALAVNPDVFILVHGGPVSMPADADYVLRHARHCHGFYGASSMERLPTEQAMTEQTRAFKRLSLASRARADAPGVPVEVAQDEPAEEDPELPRPSELAAGDGSGEARRSAPATRGPGSENSRSGGVAASGLGGGASRQREHGRSGDGGHRSPAQRGRQGKMDPEAVELLEQLGDIIQVYLNLRGRGYNINDIAWKTGTPYDQVYKAIKEDERARKGRPQ